MRNPLSPARAYYLVFPLLPAIGTIWRSCYRSSGIDPKHSPLLPTLSLATAGCLWGTGFLFGKMAFAEMTVFENCVYRFIFGSAALLPVLLRHKLIFPWRDVKLILLAAILGVPVQFLIQFKGLSLTTVSHASLMVGTAPVLLALSSAVLLHERLTHLEWMVLALSAFGAMLIAASNDHGSPRAHATAVGDLLVLASLVAAVAMILVSKRLMTEYAPLQVTAASIILGTAILLIFVELIQPVRHHFSSRVWISVAAQGILATALAYVFWNWGLARVPASRAGVFLNLEPVVGATLGVLLLGDSLTILTVAGGALIIGSAIFFSRRTRGTP